MEAHVLAYSAVAIPPAADIRRDFRSSLIASCHLLLDVSMTQINRKRAMVLVP
jgi:hypothetical protein